MTRFFSVLAALLVAIALATGVAAAQDGNESAAGDGPVCEEPAQIDRTLRLCSAGLDDGEAVLVFESDREQTIILSDMADRGLVDQRDVTLAGGEQTTVRWAVSTTDDGQAGVSIASDRALYNKVISESEPIIGGPWSAEDTQLAVLVTLLIGSIVTVGVVWHKSSGRSNEPEQMA